MLEEKSSCDVSIIVVSYNTRELTLACLESVYRETQDVSFEIIVVDNASEDASAKSIKESFPQVTLIARDENLGFAGGNNVAGAEATGKYVLLLNPDTIVLDRAIDKLVHFAVGHPEARIYGGRTLYENGSLNPSSCHRKPSLWGILCQALGVSAAFRKSTILNPDAYGGWKRDTVRTVDVISGCFLLLERELWELLEGFDLRYFMYCEEVDLCMRARVLGARPMVCPAATIVHYGGMSETSHADKIVKRLTSQVLLYDRHWSRKRAYVARWLQVFHIFRRWLTWRTVEMMGGSSTRHRASTFWQILLRRDEWMAYNSAPTHMCSCEAASKTEEKGKHSG
jgi:GT2 family glycosyltransferase